jgi:hypothetical protein
MILMALAGCSNGKQASSLPQCTVLWQAGSKIPASSDYRGCELPDGRVTKGTSLWCGSRELYTFRHLMWAFGDGGVHVTSSLADDPGYRRAVDSCPIISAG